jgi:hypothetical protein
MVIKLSGVYADVGIVAAGISAPCTSETLATLPTFTPCKDPKIHIKEI